MTVAPIIIPELQALKRRVGDEIFISDWEEIDQERVNMFAKATGDHQWIHVDVDRATKESAFGGTIAHGFLILSLCAKFSAESVKVEGISSAVNYGLNKVRFLSPVKVGSRIRGRGLVAGFEPVQGGAQVTWALTVEIEGQERPACIAETIGRYFEV